MLTSSLVSCNHYCTCGSLPSAVRVFQQALTVESNSWTTPLVLRLLSSGNYSASYCWNHSMLIVYDRFILARFYNRTREGDWSVTVDPSVLSHPVHARPTFWPCQLTEPLSNCAGQLIDPLSHSTSPLTGFKLGWPVYNPIEQLTNGPTVNNWAVTNILTRAEC